MLTPFDLSDLDGSLTISLGGREAEVRRARLGQFLLLSERTGEIERASEAKDGYALAKGIFDFLKTCDPGLERESFDEMPWYDAVNAYAAIISFNKPRCEIPILAPAPSGSGKSVHWDYPGRNGVTWIHLIAKAYAWSMEYIEGLFLEQAAALIQEIQADEQLDREFLYSLSDVSYRYNASTKTSTFIPMRRPFWMLGLKDPRMRKTKLAKKLMPVGNVVRAETDD